MGRSGRVMIPMMVGSMAVVGCERSPAASQPPSTGGRSWTSVPAPLGGSASTILVLGSGTVLVGTEDEGVFRGSPEAGWEALPDHRATPRVEALVEAPGGAVLSASFAGLFRSDDLGASWDQVGPADESYLSLAASDGVLLAGSFSSGVLRSADDGRTWSPLPGSPFGPILSLAITPGRIYAGTYGGVHRSLDGGETWSVVRGLGYVNALFADGALVLAGSRFGGLFRSGDSGTSWTSLDAAFPPFPGAFPGGIARLPDGGLVLWMDFAVFVSRDEGLTWTREAWPQTDRISHVAARADGLLVAGEDGLWAWDPGTPWRIAGLRGLSVSSAVRAEDEILGGAWTQLSGGLYRFQPGNARPIALRDQYVRDLILTPTGSVIAAASSLEEPGLGGLFRRGVGEDVWWPSAPRGADFLALAETPAGVLVAGTGPSNPLDPAGSFAEAFRSTDDGASWQPWSDGLAQATVESVLALDVSPTGDVYALADTRTGDRRILKRPAAGGMWRTLPLPADADLSRSAWAVTADGSVVTAARPDGLVRTTDDGSSWEREPGPFSGATIDGLARDGARLYAGTTSGLWARSDAAGWQRVDAVPADAHVIRVTLSGSDVVAITLDHGVFFGEVTVR